MQGISKERLQGLWHGYDTPQECNLLLKLIGECKELNPWKPIESAPKDRPVLLAVPIQSMIVANWNTKYQYFEDCDGYEIQNAIEWCELPEYPK